MAVANRTWPAVVAVVMSTMVVGCARATPATVPAAAAGQNATAHAPHPAGPAVATLPAVGPYRPVTHPPSPLPTALSAADMAALSPGVRALVLDYRSGKLSAFTFCRLAIELFVPDGTLPKKYRDVDLTQKDKIALVVTMRTAQKKLTARENAELTTQLTPALADH